MTVPPLDRVDDLAVRGRRAAASSTTRASATPPASAAEQALGELEGGEALLFASGMGAATSVVLAFLRAGRRRSRWPRARYYGTSVLFRELETLGAGVRRVRPDRGAAGRRRPRLARGAVEPVPDDARPRGGRRDIRRACSSTRLPRLPSICARSSEGADYVLHSATKYLTGHHDVTLGAVACRDPRTQSACASYAAAPASSRPPSRRGSSSAASPPSTSGCAATRRRATEIAERLGGPRSGRAGALPGLRRAALVRRRRRCRGARKVETGTRTIVNATSLGGARSTLETRRRWEGERVPESLVRLSVGLEPLEELWGDLNVALSR